MNDFAQALSDPQVRRARWCNDVPLPGGGSVPQPGNLVKLSAAAPYRPATPPPTGADSQAVFTDEVLATRRAWRCCALAGAIGTLEQIRAMSRERSFITDVSPATGCRTRPRRCQHGRQGRELVRRWWRSRRGQRRGHELRLA